MKIDVIAPSSATPNPKRKIEILGYEVRIPEDLESSNNLPYHANSDENRFKHTLAALSNTESDIVWCLRGGYGAAKIVEMLIERGFRPEREKYFIGFSDITAMHLYLNQHFGWKTIHGSVLYQLGKSDVNQENFDHIYKIIEGQNYKIKFSGLKLISETCPAREVTGAVSGGNLALITSSIGTRWQIQAADKILIIEDVSERGYKIDRMLFQLKSSGLLEGVKAMIVNFTDDLEPNGLSYVNIALSDFAKRVDFPVFSYDKIGHGFDNQPFVYGAKGMIELHEGDYIFTSSI